LIVRKGITLPGSSILVLGVTFKEDCPDVRNSKVIDVIEELKTFGATVDVSDAWADAATVREEYGIEISNKLPDPGSYDAVVLAVAHREYRDMRPDAIRALGKSVSVLFDIKSVLPTDSLDGRL